jgi:putative transcriptional regulator
MKDEDFQALLESIDQARRWLGGEDVPGIRVHSPPGGDVAAIRRRTGLSQDAFAQQIGVPDRHAAQLGDGPPLPVGPARVLLALLAKDPQIVRRTLSEAA